MSEPKKREAKLTLAEIAKHAEFQKALEKRVYDIAHRYFRLKQGSLWEPEKLSISGEVRPYPDSKVQVHSYEDGSLEDSVEVPISLVVSKNWEKKVAEWAEGEKKASEKRRKWRELYHVKEIYKKYPKEVGLIASGKEPDLA